MTLSRDDVLRALKDLGLSPAARPEELAPPQWVALAQAVGWPTGAVEAGEDT